jgi:2,4-dienoyl-CoA reductase-like NADH-dependent reductase (Old Yellow Enzyme family)/thioredoxin reductase
MSRKYQNLLSPIKVGNIVFKNRLIAARSSPIFIQGNETHPTEALITHYANKAKNGAAVVTCSGVGLPHHIPDEEIATLTPERVLPGSFDISDETCRRYLSQLAEAIHFYGAKASMQIGGYVPPRYDVSAGIPDMGGRTGQEIPVSVINEVAEDYARQAVLMKELGFDMVYLHMAYRLTIMGRFLSPLSNKRTDQYGGNLQNRARFAILTADLIKQKCGKDFILEASICGAETPGGFTLEDTIEYAKIFAGHIDLLQVRASDMDAAHPTGFMSGPTPFLYMAEAIKKSGAGIGVVTVGGYQDLDACEDVIASGKADFIAMARCWISNPEYGSLAYEGRGEDVVPCLRCNACLRSSNADPLTSVCAVNPIWGLEHKIERMITLPIERKKIAIVGGGPAGLEAALIAAGRGHEVTLYEKSGALGGLLKTTDNVSFKWPQRNFKNYLVRQIAKSNVRVLLNMEATPGILNEGEYDVVLAAVGSEPLVPRIPGAGGQNVVMAPDVYGNEKALAKSVVIIGGGEVGVETGMHLAEKGHRVTLLEMLDKLAPNAPPAHYYGQFKEAWEKLPNFKYVLKARCQRIGPDSVTYTDADGAEHSIQAGSVVIATGMKPKNDLALNFYGAADRFFMIGDCNVVGNIQKAMRSAFSTASML